MRSDRIIARREELHVDPERKRASQINNPKASGKGRGSRKLRCALHDGPRTFARDKFSTAADGITFTGPSHLSARASTRGHRRRSTFLPPSLRTSAPRASPTSEQSALAWPIYLIGYLPQPLDTVRLLHARVPEWRPWRSSRRDRSERGFILPVSASASSRQPPK
jgi:hypothetical protein